MTATAGESAEAVRGHMARAVEMGHGDEDMAATYWAHVPDPSLTRGPRWTSPSPTS